jgi:hypothetical protein
MGKAAAIAVLVLASCATPPPERTDQIDFSRPPPADWPELAVDVVHVSRADVAEHCPGLKASSLGCALVDFCAKRCKTYLAPMNDPRYSEVLEHERAHCQGFDHPGSSQGRNAWARAKAAGCGR